MIKAVLKLLRVKHWIKNCFVFAPVFFSFKLFKINALINSSCAFFIFCLISSVVYILNDIKDVQYDKLHIKNRFRPLASGIISINIAYAILITLLCASIFLLIFALHHKYLNIQFIFIILTYIIINIAYSFGLKHISLVEIFLVSFGYLLRVLAGCVAISVEPSPWILATTLILTLFITTGKRRSELVAMRAAETKRKSMKDYNIVFLDSLISMFGTATIITYMLFTASEYSIHKFQSSYLIFTSIFVIFGVSRYMQLIKVADHGEAPTDLIVSDKNLFITIFLWLLSLFILIYR